MNTYKFLIALLAVLILIVAPAVQAGDVIDFLPESILARSFASLLTVGPFVSEPCPPIAEIELPENLILDENGVFRDQNEIRDIVAKINCLLSASTSPETREETEELYKDIISALEGNDVELSGGVILPGSKQSVRVMMMNTTLLILAQELEFSQSRIEFEPLGPDPCSGLRDWILDGTTLEQRWTAMLFYADTFFQSRDREEPAPCGDEFETNNPELIEAAKLGDLDAATQLTLNWADELRSLANEPEEADLEVIENRKEEFGLIILENFESAPLLNLAASVALVFLFLAELQLQQVP